MVVVEIKVGQFAFSVSGGAISAVSSGESYCIGQQSGCRRPTTERAKLMERRECLTKGYGTGTTASNLLFNLRCREYASPFIYTCEKSFGRCSCQSRNSTFSFRRPLFWKLLVRHSFFFSSVSFQDTDNPAVQLQGPYIINKLIPPPAHRNVIMIAAGTGINPSKFRLQVVVVASAVSLLSLRGGKNYIFRNDTP